MYVPKLEDIKYLKSLAAAEWKKMPVLRLRGQYLDDADYQHLAVLQAAIQLLNKDGAIRPEWLRKQSLAGDFPQGKPGEPVEE